MRVAAALVGLCCALLPWCADAAGCDTAASDACYFGFEPPAAQGRLHYYASIPPGTAAAAEPTRALIALHGHPRDAGKTFDAALRAVRQGGRAGDTLVVAPLFQVDDARAARCSTPGMPRAQPGDLLWTCASWLEGAPSVNGAGLGSFAALDALVAELLRQWPGLRVVTVAGFSAGAQMVQHAIGFAAPAPAGVALRYVVADPGTWLYFDAFRPAPVDPAACPEVNRWKYGLDALPAHLPRTASQTRAAYAAAEIHYLEGALDSGDGKGTAYRALDKSCAADAQGPFRLQRGQAYVAHERTLRGAALEPRALVVVPRCAHDVACVFPAPEARAALLGVPR
ncbi:hypothetical protein [Xylophilus ampelinus]|uniref:Uncharacterized protein n=1 Tax=Xylophilus ampelinus TaxID=54067 RepID=A0A318SDC0_9BURK|nr:hypothetical protein [Xylophilus ampelinus]MCS4511728.1 hypothetical protein [Xylophilus ampelinus]PYE73780.1 hypothetical protein DFQ15_13217 [Xylophilus ampelinus]